MTTDSMTRCGWCLNHPLYMTYHDIDWGVPLYDDQKLFEFLILEGMQAGLSWLTVLKKREAFREAFLNFDAEKIVRFTEEDTHRLLQNKDIIRNKLKINAAIVNARAYLQIKEKGTFSDFIWQFVGGFSQQNHWEKLEDVPASTSQSDEMSCVLKLKQFKFVGSTICYAFMQATGMVNDHLVDCFRHNEV